MPALEEYKRGTVCAHAVCLRTSGSGKAILVRFDDDDEDRWIPVSQIDDESEVYQTGDDGNLVITEWIANEKGWL